MSAFGTEFTDNMVLAWFRDGTWSDLEIKPVAPLCLHPAAHVLHYSSTCFDGLKAYRHPDGSLQIFRLDRHVARLRHSADRLCLPAPDEEALKQAIITLVADSRELVPEYPGALYLRPVICGTEAHVGAAGHASSEACLFILASPVGAYFEGESTLRILIDDQHMRSAPDFGVAKSGGNYAAALHHIEDARRDHKADQVLFCPGGDVQETGATNFLLLDDKRIVTRAVDGAILHGVTRESLLTLAPSLDYQVEERPISVEEVLAWSKQGEAAVSGTAAVLTGIGTFIYQGEDHLVGDGKTGATTQRLRDALSAIHRGARADEFGWLTSV